MGIIRNILSDLLDNVDSCIASKIEDKLMKLTRDKCKAYEYELPNIMKKSDIGDNSEKGQKLLFDIILLELTSFDDTTKPMIDKTESAKERKFLEKKQCMLAEGIINKIEKVYEEYITNQVMARLSVDEKFTLLINYIRKLKIYNLHETYGYYDLLKGVLSGYINMDEVQNKDDIVDKFKGLIIDVVIVDMSLYRAIKQRLLQDKQLKKFIDRRCWISK